ncbi:hypothetical protein Cpir12675_002654 [Ceratocystis pirilliformis]|uniref:RRM domain-containing protein n=1 Tax=Ceratocystis pirilliformis TaxID=259994 RepID=A0ABR3Z7R7_9PEZI
MTDTMDLDTAPVASSVATGVSSEMKTHEGATAVRSVEGWIIAVSNLHEEMDEESLLDQFREFGEIKSMHMNLDRRSGYAKGYALIEYATLDEARQAIDSMRKEKMLDQTINVDFAFVRPPPGIKLSGAATSNGGPRGGPNRGRQRSRSRSPMKGR